MPLHSQKYVAVLTGIVVVAVLVAYALYLFSGGDKDVFVFVVTVLTGILAYVYGYKKGYGSGYAEAYRKLRT